MFRYPACISSCFRVISLTNKQKIEATRLQLNDVCQEFTPIDSTIIDRLEASMPPLIISKLVVYGDSAKSNFPSRLKLPKLGGIATVAEVVVKHFGCLEYLLGYSVPVAVAPDVLVESAWLKKFITFSKSSHPAPIMAGSAPVSATLSILPWSIVKSTTMPMPQYPSYLLVGAVNAISFDRRRQAALWFSFNISSIHRYISDILHTVTKNLR